MGQPGTQFGVFGTMFPPADIAVESYRRIEAQGWDFLQFSDQMQSSHPLGLLVRPVADEDPSAVGGGYSDTWFASGPMMAAAAVATSRIGIHLGAMDPLRKTPSLFAQEAVTLSHLSQGRTAWHIAQGESKQFEPYGETRTKPLARMEEAIRVMHALWESGGEPISRNSEFWPLKDAVFTLPLFQGTKPRFLIVGGGERIERLTGELGNGWSTYLPGGIEDDVDALAATITKIKRAAADHGRDPEALDFFGMVVATPAETDEEAWRLACHPVSAWIAIAAGSMASGSTWKKWGFDHPLGDFLWARDLRVTLVSPDEAMKMAEAVPEEVTNHSLVWGTPERIAQRCQQYIDAGITHLSFFNFSAMADPALSQDFAPLASEILVKLGGKPLAL